jgi:nicotinate dehydrogenase subunit A
MAADQITFEVNGYAVSVTSDTSCALVHILRNDLKLKGTRYGCGEGACGSCTVMLDGRAVQSCDTPLWAVQGRDITTVEGLGTPEHPHPVQAAFIAEQAAQCGYCIDGIMITIAALLKAEPAASDDRIKEANISFSTSSSQTAASGVFEASGLEIPMDSSAQ